MFENSKWIWNSNTYGKDTYCEFVNKFDYNGQGNVVINISCDSDYVLFVNGKFVASNQYSDYEFYKIYDSIKINKFLQKGKNIIAVLVWYFGIETTSRYYPYLAGLIYQVDIDGTPVLFSDQNTLSRKSLCYKSGQQKTISRQLGLSFYYDARMEDEWISGVAQYFENSIVVDKKCTFFSRPNNKLKLLAPMEFSIVLNDENKRFVIDLGKESVGLPMVKFYTDQEQEVNFSWGEHIIDGGVRRKIHYRDFSFGYYAKKGFNSYVNYMFRIGARYIELNFDLPVQLEYVGVIPQVYPVDVIASKLDNQLDATIYSLCLNTLKNCMLEHYVDCPWREQALYSLDGRNQMLCGYYAFEKNNAKYVRSNLLLISKDSRSDGLLSICFPSKLDLTIPSYSLYYILAVLEYIEHTGDKTILSQVMSKIENILSSFCNNMKGGLVCKFPGKNYWNFYDWSKFHEGSYLKEDVMEQDAVINALMVLALNSYKKLCSYINRRDIFLDIATKIKEKINQNFFDVEKGLYFVSKSTRQYTEVVNSLMVYSGVADDSVARRICQEIVEGNLVPCSLCMKVFVYDALILTDVEKYSSYILQQIRKEYKYMLDNDATSTWETMEGNKAFDNAGSLCHGWSATPLYIYYKLGLVNNK